MSARPAMRRRRGCISRFAKTANRAIPCCGAEHADADDPCPLSSLYLSMEKCMKSSAARYIVVSLVGAVIGAIFTLDMVVQAQKETPPAALPLDELRSF